MEHRTRSTDEHNGRSQNGEIQFASNFLKIFALWFTVFLRDHGCDPLVNHSRSGAQATWSCEHQWREWAMFNLSHTPIVCSSLSKSFRL